MARIQSLSMLNSEDARNYLAEQYGKVLDFIAKNTISGQLKNTDLSGDPSTGTVEASRFANTESKAYGTARTGNAGQKLVDDKVTVPVDVDRELINEVEEKDTLLYGVDGLITRKSTMNQGSMQRELERAFFTCAATYGTHHTPTATAINEKVEELIQTIENTKNAWVDGVDRTMIRLVANTTFYGQIRTYLDTTQNANVNTDAEDFVTFHGVRIYSSVYLPAYVDIIGMVVGSVAQPIMTTMDAADKFPASNAYHFGMFYSYGTEAVMPDLIQWMGTVQS